MDYLTSENIRELISSQTGPCASVYLPTGATSNKGQQDVLQLKNLLNQVEKEFVAAGVRGPEAATLVQPARKLLTDELFWQQRSEGLVVFLAKSVFHAFRLPLSFEVSAAVGPRFCVRPLLPLLDGDGHFYVLAFSQNQVRLMVGTRFGIDAVEVARLPRNMAQALNYDEAEAVGQSHTGSPGRGKQASVFHGQGVKADAHKDDLEKYCRAIDRAVQEHLRSSSAPLVLAAVEYEIPIYRRVNSYAHLLKESVVGNPDRLQPKQLHEKAWPLAGATMDEARQAAWQRYHRLAGTDKTLDDFERIVTAAREGRVETLMVTPAGHKWGSFEPESGELRMFDQRQPGDEDLVEVAAAETVLHGGTVYVARPDELPAGHAAVALLRYS